jgi:hypothetical protein
LNEQPLPDPKLPPRDKVGHATLEDQQVALLDALRHRRPEIAPRYSAAIIVLKNADVPERLPLVAHALRELLDELPGRTETSGLAPLKNRVDELAGLWRPALEERQAAGPAAWTAIPGPSLEEFLVACEAFFQQREVSSSSRRETQRSFLEELDVATPPLPKDIQARNAAQWMRLRQFFLSVAHYGHRPTEDEFREKVAELENFLFTRLVPRPDVDFSTLDELLKVDPANSPDVVEKACIEVHKNRANYDYLFEKVPTSGWLMALAGRGFFRRPQPPVEVDDGTLLPPWPESRYLVRVANNEPTLAQSIADLACSTEATYNTSVHYDLLKIALALPPRLAVRLVPRVRSWVRAPFRGLVDYEIQDLIVHLANGQEVDGAFRVADEAFALQEDQPSSSWNRLNNQAWLEDWYYDRALKIAVPALVGADALRTIKKLCSLLDRALRMYMGDVPDDEDYSESWHKAIEFDEPHPEVLSSLVSASRISMELAIQKAPDDCNATLKILQDQRWKVFRRIELHLLRRFSELAMDEIIRLAPELVELDDSTQLEGAKLLENSFDLLPNSTKIQVLERIAGGPEEGLARSRMQFMEVEPIPEEIAAFERRWRAQRYVLVQRGVPSEWEARVQEALAGRESIPRLDQFSVGRVWVESKRSTKGTRALETASPSEAIAFLREWSLSNDRDGTPVDLGHTLRTMVEVDPASYADLTSEFENLEPTLVGYLFQGFEAALRKERIFDWEPVLTLAQRVVANPWPMPVSTLSSMERDVDWQASLRAIASLLEEVLISHEGRGVRLELRQLLWSVIEPLTEHSDPTPEREDEYLGSHGEAAGPFNLCINTIRGKAFAALVGYFLWVHREPADETAPPIEEVLQALNRRLETDPSLAIRSAFGRYFPWLFLVAPAWARNAVRGIFPRDRDLTVYWKAAWETYILHCSAYDDLLQPLRDDYARAILEVTAVSDERRGSPAEGLAVHFANYFWREQLDQDDPLISGFFGTVPAAIRGQFLESIGRGLCDLEQPVTEQREWRLKELWESRTAAAAESGWAASAAEELGSFGWWFASGQMDPLWRFRQLRLILSNFRQIDVAFKVSEELERLAKSFPLESIECLDLLLKRDRPDWAITEGSEHTRRTLEIALASGDTGAESAAGGVVNYLLSRRLLGYRDLVRIKPER